MPFALTSRYTRTMVFASARPQSVGVVSLVTRSANVAGTVVTPLSLSPARPSLWLAASGKPNETGGRRIDRDLQEEVVADVAGAVFDFELQVVHAVGQRAVDDRRVHGQSVTAASW